MADEKELRAEIVDAEKARVDFQKWKLVLVAGLGAAALGLGTGGESGHQQGEQNRQLLLCLIPLVCGYVDLLCKHITLRILVIAAYLRRFNEATVKSSNALDYEGFVQKARDKVNPYVMEDWVMHFSTLFLSAGVAFRGGLWWVKGWSPFFSIDVLPYLASGILGVGVFCLVQCEGGRKEQRLKDLDLKPESDSVGRKPWWRRICS